MRKAIVTGANGFIGKALVNELLENGVTVYALAHSITGRGEPDGSRLKFIPFELGQADSFEYDFGDGVDVFYHLAWQGSSGEERGDPVLQYANLGGTMSCLRLAQKAGAKRFVGAGSLMEKEALLEVPKPGEKPPSVSAYGTAKLAAHYMTKTMAAGSGSDIDHLWCYITAYGPGDNPHRFLNATVKKLLNNERTIAFTKADQYYDFVYVTDVAKALYLIGLKGTPFKAYQIGSGKPRPLNCFIHEMKKVLNAQSELNFGAYDYKSVYLPAGDFDCSDLQNDTGFVCGVPFAEGVLNTAEWLRRNSSNE